ncbi:hypothetical protein F66182_11266 [Fusarium sp. NRRL 66182]|nr:hypothetical protein F66182_11266 [Fusarium sp. NRRL 66182]
MKHTSKPNIMNSHFALLIGLVGSVLAFDRTCIDISFDSDINVLSARCQPRDNSGHIPTDLDLNRCFGFSGTEITPTYNGNFGTSCRNCYLYKAPDPWYGNLLYWMSCTCTDQNIEASVPLQVAVAHEYVHNEDGHLTC